MRFLGGFALCFVLLTGPMVLVGGSAGQIAMTMILVVPASLLPALYLLLVTPRDESFVLELRTDGLSFRSSSMQGVAPWSELCDLRIEHGGVGWGAFGGAAFHSFSARLATARWSLSLDRRFAAAVEAARAGAHPIVWRAAVDALAAGADVHFGAVMVTPETLQVGRRSWRWSELREVRVTRRWFVVRPRRGWRLVIPAARVSFADVAARVARVRVDGAEGPPTLAAARVVGP